MTAEQLIDLLKLVPPGTLILKSVPGISLYIDVLDCPVHQYMVHNGPVLEIEGEGAVATYSDGVENDAGSFIAVVL